MTAIAQVQSHKWELGTGLTAPFVCVGVWSFPNKGLQETYPESYSLALQSMPKDYMCGMCAICGMGLVHNFLIHDAMGKKFAVGCDCVQKTGDSALITKAEKLEKAAKHAKKQADREAKQAAMQAKYESELNAQRARNNGMTDSELEQQEIQAEKARKAAFFIVENAWLISALKGHGNFSDSMAQMLTEGELNTARFSPRSIGIMAEIYGKYFGRMGSKAYTKAYEFFYTKVKV